MSSLAPSLLVAMPDLADPNFRRTVVLLCAHGPEGSFGVVVNRRAPMTVADLSSDHALLEGRKDPLWVGGPVQTDTLQVLHRLAPGVPGSLAVVGGVHLGGDPAVLRALLDEESPGGETVRFFLGYSGWGEGQLEEELEAGAWIVRPADAALVFDPEPGTLWRRLLRGLGASFAGVVDEPPDPSWN